MKVLGISGFENAVPYLKSRWPGLDEREYRISQGHDAAAALVVDGEIVAASAEERFDRRKHSAHFPARAICDCLTQAGLALEDIDELVHAFDYAPFQKAFSLDPEGADRYRQVFSRDALLAQVARDLPRFPKDRVYAVNHHLAHAASAYFTSGWGECLVIVIDGMGETQSASVFRAHAGKLDKIYEISAHDSIGILYSLVTLHLGFDFNSDEYKIMGLAPYGDPARFRGFFEEAVRMTPDGGFQIPALRLNRTREDRERYSATRRHLGDHLGPERTPDAEVLSVHRDIAAALQECLDRAMLHLCGHFASATGLRKLALAGGVALNCTANGHLMRSGQFDEIYIQPAAGDDGSALGAALHRSAVAGEVRNRRMPVPFLGPSHAIHSDRASQPEVEGAIRHASLEDACEAAASLIADGRVIAWYRARMEFGPRALGHRSILADPSRPEMRDRINAMVKMREAFRPFAPAVTVEQVHRWFDVAPGSRFPYMIATVDVRKEFRSGLPAVTHVDGSARVQTVSADDNPEFHTLLRAVGRLTGREVVLNTSFNVKGQPIVNTPGEAIDTFRGTGIEHLFLENLQISKDAHKTASRAR
jgi:carbamoyltransferase